MIKDLIIDSSPAEVNIALMEDKQLAELHKERKGNNFSVGDIFLGKVKKIIPSLNAAFVDVGYEKDAFLHYLDLGPQLRSLNKFTKFAMAGTAYNGLLDNLNLEPDIEKTGKMAAVLTVNQLIPVQIAKEPISTKGPRISSEISIPGRDMVLIPFSDAVSISQKIKSSEERQRLKRLMMSIKPKNFGVIIRTAAEGKSVAELDADLKDLVEKWKSMSEALRTATPAKKILGELNRTSAILRDLLNADFQGIHVNDPALFEEVKSYIQAIAPEKQEIVKLYKGKASIFEHFGVDKQIKGLFGKTVTMSSGAYLVVEHTEALHVIDVNSGVRSSRQGDNQENSALQVNLEAAKEIARQLRLRDMGGIIVIDFIDMRSGLNRKQLYDSLNEAMRRDRAKHKILPPSRFGLVQLTRQRVRPEMNIVTSEKCPACNGTGEVRASVLLIDDIENSLRYFFKEQNEPSITLCVHPFVEAYITRGLFSSVVKKWKRKFGKKITVKADSSFHFLEFRFFNRMEEEIKL